VSMGTYRYVVYGTAPLEMQPGDFWWGRKTSTFAIEVARNLSRGHAKVGAGHRCRSPALAGRLRPGGLRSEHGSDRRLDSD
jgi:hypothetical protein